MGTVWVRAEFLIAIRNEPLKDQVEHQMHVTNNDDEQQKIQLEKFQLFIENLVKKMNIMTKRKVIADFIQSMKEKLIKM
jgi:hypothetical protein